MTHGARKKGEAEGGEGSARFGAETSRVAGETRLPWGLAWRLAAGQITAWGILYYAFTVVVGPMQGGTGWSRTFLNAGVSIGLLAWGVLALPVGAWIQRRGGRGLMTATAGLGGAALVLMGSVVDPVAYVVAWLLLGAAMAGMLYDASFAVVTQAFGPQYRRGITLITLVGGLASTVFIPLAQLAVDHLGWQGALVALGVFHAGVSVPLHWLGLPRWRAASREGAVRSGRERWREWWREFRRDVGDPRFVGLAVWFTGYAAASTGLIFQLVPALQASGAANATILQAIAIFGPMQVLGRFVLTTRGDNFSTLWVGRWAMAALLGAALILLVLPPKLPALAAFAVLFGAGNGVLTILRGTAIAELFGRERYPELNGALSAPAVLAKAASPLVLAWGWSAAGEVRVVFAGVVLCVLVSAGGLALTTLAQRRQAAGG
jgi:MFS family permease